MSIDSSASRILFVNQWLTQSVPFGIFRRAESFSRVDPPMAAFGTTMTKTLCPFALCLVLTAGNAHAQICKPVSQRTGEMGCWITASAMVGRLPPAPMFWHLDTYLTREAAEAAKGPRGTLVESFQKVWLLSIDVAGWRAAGGTRVAEIGPLPLTGSATYAVQYMEAVFSPGMTAPAHRHSGPEAWYTLTGETCLETPSGKMVGAAGGSHVIVPGGSPMHLTATGTATRRALVLILHDSTEPPTTPVQDWVPKGLCRG